MRQDAALEQGAERVLDGSRQLRAGAGLGVGDDAGRLLLHQSLQRGLRGAVALAVDRGAIGRPLGLPADPWSLVRAHRQHLRQGLPATYRAHATLAVGPVAPEAAARGYERVLACGGASIARDAADERVLRRVRHRRRRIIDSQSEVGGWPLLRRAAMLPDSDGDGTPDARELQQRLDPRDRTDGARIDPVSGAAAAVLAAPMALPPLLAWRALGG